LHPANVRHKEGVLAIRELLKRDSISRYTYYDLVGFDLGEKLLETNVFSYHISSGEVTFQSTAMKRYCELESASWEGI
jgi:hypothetical protein